MFNRSRREAVLDLAMLNRSLLDDDLAAFLYPDALDPACWDLLGRPLSLCLALRRLAGRLALRRLAGRLALRRLAGRLALRRLAGRLALRRLAGRLALRRSLSSW